MLSADLVLVTILTWSISEANKLYKEVLINAKATISCIPNEDIRIQWQHTAPDGFVSYIYAGGSFYVSPNRGFRLEKVSNTGPYHLVIPNAKDEDAGLYECKEDGIGSRMFNSTNLTVLESSPDCGLDMESQGYVGPSTCNLEQEDMTFTCVQRFNGKHPKMIWTTLFDSQHFEESRCKIEKRRITCSIIIRADSKYDGSTFNCQTTKSTAECSTKNIKIHYFERHLVDGKPPLVVKNIGDKVNCSVNSNQIVHFKWTRIQEGQRVNKTEDQEVLIDEPGLYRCVVKYRIRHVPCEARVTEVNVHNPATTPCEPPKALASGTAGTTAISVLSAFTVTSIVVTIVFRYCV